MALLRGLAKVRGQLMQMREKPKTFRIHLLSLLLSLLLL